MDAALARQSKLARLLRLGEESLVVMNPDKRAIVGRETGLGRREAHGETDDVERRPVVTCDAVGLEQVAEFDLQADNPTIRQRDLGGEPEPRAASRCSPGSRLAGRLRAKPRARARHSLARLISSALSILGRLTTSNSFTRDRFDVGLEMSALEPVDPHDCCLSGAGERPAERVGDAGARFDFSIRRDGVLKIK